MRSDRPEDWVPEENASVDYDNCDEICETLPVSADKDIMDIYGSYHDAGMPLPDFL